MTLDQLADLIDSDAPLPIVADACEEAGFPMRAAFFRNDKGRRRRIRAAIARRIRARRPYGISNDDLGNFTPFLQIAAAAREWDDYLNDA